MTDPLTKSWQVEDSAKDDATTGSFAGVFDSEVPPAWFTEALIAKLTEVCSPAVAGVRLSLVKFWWSEFRQLMPEHADFRPDLSAFVTQLAYYIRQKHIDSIKDRLEGTTYE